MCKTDVKSTKRGSSVSNARAKSRHKHTYKSCLLDIDGAIYIASYCTKCGKIGENIDEESRSHTVKMDDGRYRMLTQEEILYNNSDLEVFEVKNFSDNYVSIYKKN